MKIRVKRNTHIIKLLDENATYIIANGTKYYFLPFWFVRADKAHLLMYNIETLPENVKKAIERYREGLSENPMDKNILHYPLTEKECYKNEK